MMSSSVSMNNNSSSRSNNKNAQNNNNNNNNNTKDLYLNDIPANERQSLCAILDELNVWEDLALNHMGYRKTDIIDIKRAMHIGNSPTDELLTMWSEQNHTVTELFILLYRMQQYTAMDAIRNLVDQKYHRLIMSGQPALSALLSHFNNNSDNSNNRSEKILNGPLRASKTSPSSSSSRIKGSSNNVTTKSNNESSSLGFGDQKTEDEQSSFNMKCVNEYASTIPQIDYKELLEATNNWNTKNILGKGGFGTVFKGTWKYTSVAIKRIEYHGTGTADINKIQIQQSLNELKYLNSCRHDNILPLYGYSINGDEPCLVYQLMTGGSLEQRLGTNKYPPLTWHQRLNIAQGTARGLQYLHTFKEKPLIHGDIKPANILLDPCTIPKIGDFGLAREGPNALNSSMEVSKVYGTKPYLPVEFLGYKCLSTKVDVFSFGVVLLELVTGQRAYDKTRQHKFLTKHILNKCDDENVSIEQLMDKNLPIDLDAIRICKNLITLGKTCVADKPEQRPEMVMVLWHLVST